MFFKKHKEFHPVEIVLRTVFLTSLISFLVFLTLDLLRPGFVSRTISVHVFLAVAVVSGFFWSHLVKRVEEGKWPVSLFALIFGLAGIFVSWNFRADLSDYLVVVLPLAAIVPFLVIYLLHEK
jgi:hypothetical protein